MDESQKHAMWKTPENKGYILSVHLHKILEKAKSMTKQIDGCQELGVCVRGMGVDGKGQEEGQKWSTSWFSQSGSPSCVHLPKFIKLPSYNSILLYINDTLINMPSGKEI